MQVGTANTSKLPPFLQATSWHKGRRRRSKTSQSAQFKILEDVLLATDADRFDGPTLVVDYCGPWEIRDHLDGPKMDVLKRSTWIVQPHESIVRAKVASNHP
jgi:hypothetical protein